MEAVRLGVFLFSLTPGNGTWSRFGFCEKTFQLFRSVCGGFPRWFETSRRGWKPLLTRTLVTDTYLHQRQPVVGLSGRCDLLTYRRSAGWSGSSEPGSQF